MGIGRWERVLLKANFGRPIVTNEDFTAYLCDSAATRLSSQITLGRVIIIIITITILAQLAEIFIYTGQSAVCVSMLTRVT